MKIVCYCEERAERETRQSQKKRLLPPRCAWVRNDGRQKIDAGVSGFTDAERGTMKESRSYDPALKMEPNTMKYPAQVVGVIEPCAGEIKKRSPAKTTGMGVRSESAGYPRRQLEQRYDELACIRPQQCGQHEHRSQQQLWVSCREHSLTSRRGLNPAYDFPSVIARRERRGNLENMGEER